MAASWPAVRYLSHDRESEGSIAVPGGAFAYQEERASVFCKCRANVVLSRWRRGIKPSQAKFTYRKWVGFPAKRLRW